MNSAHSPISTDRRESSQKATNDPPRRSGISHRSHIEANHVAGLELLILSVARYADGNESL
jgi:hypothetical protein